MKWDHDPPQGKRYTIRYVNDRLQLHVVDNFTGEGRGFDHDDSKTIMNWLMREPPPDPFMVDLYMTPIFLRRRK